MLVLKNATVFDGVNETLLENCSVVIKDDRIYEVHPCDQTVYENCDVIDLTGKYLLPGLIDGHMHCLLSEVPPKHLQLESKTPGGGDLDNQQAYISFIGAHSARKCLEAGFTTVFDGGAPYYIDVALKECIENGMIPGPDYYISGQQISVGPGHYPGLGYVANGENEMRKAVRQMLWWGVDHIKLKISAPMRMSRRNVARSEMSIAEITAACDEAHSAGIMVGGHVRGAQPIKDFIAGGGDWIIHGTGIDDEGIELMLKKNLYLFETLASVSKDPPTPEMYAAKPQRVLASMQKSGLNNFNSVKRAYEAGVNIVLATDTGGFDIWPGENAKEMLRLKEIGMKNVEILRSATSTAAKGLGIDHKVGRIEPDLKAHLVVVDKNPLEDISVMLNVKMVIKDGKIVKNNL